MTFSLIKLNNDIPHDIFNIICNYHYTDFKQIFNKIVPTLVYPVFFLDTSGSYYLSELEAGTADNELYFSISLDPADFEEDFESHEILLSLHSCHCHGPTGLDQKTIIDNNMVRLIKRQSTIKMYDVLLFLKLINYNPSEICDHRYLEMVVPRPLQHNNELIYYEMFFGS